MSYITPSFNFDKTKDTYALSGDLVYSTVPDFVSTGESFFAQSKSNILIDCSGLKRGDSAGLSLLLEWKRQCQKLDKECLYKALPPQVTSLVKTFKLQALIV